ncbi:hypothetical protein Sjap_009619 [Stephania japonica]|uniref:Phorbol-ester/DAG-type domain-containing protein n=1 Tax=Stephania japonica TaxID=461633 RepID=A0AAP0J7F7_9MAGN
MFTCAGCKDFGAGPRFRCETCNYDLHELCALAPPYINHLPGNSTTTTTAAVVVHHAPLQGQSHHQLLFHTKPAGGIGLLRSTCGMCGKTIRGYCFRCGTCNLEIHPCCSKLRQEMRFPIHPLHPMLLLPPPTIAGMTSPTVVASPALGGHDSCGLCHRKRGGMVYGCQTCGYQIHAVCAKPMVNGLYASGIIKAPDNDNNKPNMLGTAARVASHVILGFIGGLIEGIGEGIGEALVDKKKALVDKRAKGKALVTTYIPPPSN